MLPSSLTNLLRFPVRQRCRIGKRGRYIMPQSPLRLLQLLQLADSAVPIGAASHSYGLETLTSDGVLDVAGIAGFLVDILDETGRLEGGFCRAAYRLAVTRPGSDPGAFRLSWQRLNERIAAFKPARESRVASATLGRRLLQLAVSLEEHPLLRDALTTATGAVRTEIHHAAAFGLICGALGVEEETAVATFLHQMVAGYISAFQRLLPLGQSQAARLLWSLKPAIEAAASASGNDRDDDEIGAFTPILDWASMRHPTLRTRLFIS